MTSRVSPDRPGIGRFCVQVSSKAGEPVSRHHAFNRSVNRLTPQMLKDINERVVQALGLEDGKKLRVDTTVVQTDIHHPTDNTSFLRQKLAKLASETCGHIVASAFFDAVYRCGALHSAR
jgi:hypothetical protein